MRVLSDFDACVCTASMCLNNKFKSPSKNVVLPGCQLLVCVVMRCENEAVPWACSGTCSVACLLVCHDNHMTYSAGKRTSEAASTKQLQHSPSDVLPDVAAAAAAPFAVQRFGQVLLVDAPWFFSGPWELIKPLLRKYAALVRFVSRQELAQQYFSADTLPDQFQK